MWCVVLFYDEKIIQIEGPYKSRDAAVSEIVKAKDRQLQKTYPQLKRLAYPLVGTDEECTEKE